jgi:hypothetical protein
VTDTRRYATIAEFILDHHESFEDVMFVLGLVAIDDSTPDELRENCNTAADVLVLIQRMSGVDISGAPGRINARFNLFFDPIKESPSS